MPDLAALLVDIRALSAAIEDAAAGEDWPAVERLDEARYAAIAALSGCADQTGDEIKSVLEHALAVTNSVLERARSAQARDARALRDVQRGQRGTRAYHGAAS